MFLLLKVFQNDPPDLSKHMANPAHMQMDDCQFHNPFLALALANDNIKLAVPIVIIPLHTP